MNFRATLQRTSVHKLLAETEKKRTLISQFTHPCCMLRRYAKLPEKHARQIPLASNIRIRKYQYQFFWEHL